MGIHMDNWMVDGLDNRKCHRGDWKVHLDLFRKMDYVSSWHILVRFVWCFRPFRFGMEIIVIRDHDGSPGCRDRRQLDSVLYCKDCYSETYCQVYFYHDCDGDDEDDHAVQCHPWQHSPQNHPFVLYDYHCDVPAAAAAAEVQYLLQQ